MNSMTKTHDHLFLKKTIESIRNEMIRVGIQEGLSSEKTIEISQRLDQFIAKYQSLK